MNPIRRLREGWRALRTLRKKGIARLFQRVLDRRFSSESFNADQIRRIALFRWDDKLGDTFWATRLISNLKTRRPELQVSLITGPVSAKLVRDWPLIDRVLVTARGGKAAWRLGRYAGEFDLVIDLGDSLSWKEWLALNRLRAPHYLGYDRSHTRLFDVNVAPEHCHAGPRNQAAAALVTGQWREGGFYLPRSETADASVHAQLLAHPGPAVLVNLFGSSKHRQFSAEDSQRLLQTWVQQFPEQQLWLLAVPGKEEMVTELVNRCAHPHIHSTGEVRDFALTTAWLAQTDLVFTPDTSIVHFAMALNKPLIAIYATNPRNFALWGVSGPHVRTLFTRAPHSRHDRVNVAEFDQGLLHQAIAELTVPHANG